MNVYFLNKIWPFLSKLNVIHSLVTKAMEYCFNKMIRMYKLFKDLSF